MEAAPPLWDITDDFHGSRGQKAVKAEKAERGSHPVLELIADVSHPEGGSRLRVGAAAAVIGAFRSSVDRSKNRSALGVL